MNGPTAPKDPEKKRPFFYIMREKEVFGSRQENGKGVQFIYEDDGRLINSAQIVGNITEQEVLERLKTVKGFRELVHSIGISVEAENREEAVQFIFQMYGKRDPFGGGTLLCADLKGDGAEVRLPLDEIIWREDDDRPGQIRFEFDTPEKLASVSVRFYLQDGFSVPEPVEDDPLDYNTQKYKQMISQSLLEMGNTLRLKNAMKKAQRGEAVTMAYIGGSITQGAGATPINTECYAYKSYRLFAERFAIADNVEYRKAGVGGTPSELGMIRFDRDVLRGKNHPDIVVVEFAVNDEGDETRGDCYESLVRKILALPNHPAVVLLFSVFANDYNLQERMIPIGQQYHLPMVSIKNAVTPQFYKKKGEGRVLSKNQFFYDIFHPNNDGHTIMADCLDNLFLQVSKQEETGETDDMETWLKKPPVVGNTFEVIQLLDRKDCYEDAKIQCGGFNQIDQELQSVEMDENLEPTPEFPHNWMYKGQGVPYFEMLIKARSLVMVFKDSGEVDAADVEVYVDGNFVRKVDPHDNGWLHCNPVLLYSEPETGEHLVRIQIPEGQEKKKATILGFGYVR